MPRLMFVMPVHGRPELTAVCLRQLRRTCDFMRKRMLIEADAVIVGDDSNVVTARELGFGMVERDNEFLSRKFNDGIQLACDPEFNPRPAHYVVPFGSDDWCVPEIFSKLPGHNEVVAFRVASFVSEDGRELSRRLVNYDAGVGIRIFPAPMMARVGYRPADEDRKRACDTSILVNLKNSYGQDGPGLRIVYNDTHDYQIVDWKSSGEQLNSYEVMRDRFQGPKSGAEDPFKALEPFYPAESLEDMRALKFRARVRRTMVEDAEILDRLA